MLKIGVTGGIGSGKTTVCQIFELLGIPVFYADEVAKTLMVTDEVLKAQIRDSFGEEAYFVDGGLNRKYLSALVFKNSELLALLNSFVHPAVFSAMEHWTSQQHGFYVLKEAALLFESGSYRQNDYNILVSTTDDLRIERVMKRDGLTAEKVKERIQSQMPEEEKQAKADFFISNNGDEFLITQVLQLHHQFVEIATQR